MKHDPEKNAAAYLSSTMSRRRRQAFEQHILECEDCWSEVDVARRGRSLAETARNLAPQSVRERIRMTVEATSLPSRRWRRVAVGALAVAALGVLVVLAFTINSAFEQPKQPEEIALLVADFNHSASIGNIAPRKLPERLGDLRLHESKAGRVGGMGVTAHSYADRAGHQVVVYQADKSFPVAAGAEHALSGETWTAEVEGAVLFCADHPVPSLVVGDDQKEVHMAAAELGLR
jgi:hypothetical protein